MKRKFYGVLMLGALAVASASLTSCKDYDDDISALQTQIDQKADKTVLDQTKTALQTEVATLTTQLNDAKTSLASLGTATTDNAGKIKDLLASIAALETRITSCETAIKNIATVQEALNGKVDEAEYQQKLIEIYAMVTAIDTKFSPSLETIATLQKGLADETTARLAVEKDLQEQIAALQALVTKLQEAGTGLGDLTDIQSAIKALQDQIANIPMMGSVEELKTQVKAIVEDPEVTNAIVQQVITSYTNINVMNVFQENHLRSLVFIPQTYYWGIEAAKVTRLSPKPFNQNWKQLTTYIDNDEARLEVIGTKRTGSKENGVNYTDVNMDIDVHERYNQGSAITVMLDATAEYHLNPSNAVIANNATLKVLSANTSYTRSKGSATVSLLGEASKERGIWTVENHKLIVPLNVVGAVGSVVDKADGTPDNANSGVTTFATQLTYNDTTITSDYAAVIEETIENLRLSHVPYVKQASRRQKDTDFIITGMLNKHCGQCAVYKLNSNPMGMHLFATVGEAKAFVEENTEGQDLVPYQSDINLTELVETHYTDKGGNHYKFEGSTFNRNFAYKFELTDFRVSGGNNTNESAHAAIYTDEDGNFWLHPQDPEAGGLNGKEYSKDNKATEVVVNRVPLVRVSLIYTAGGKNEVVDYGYLPIRITKDKEILPPKPYSYTSYASKENVGVVRYNDCYNEGAKDVNAITTNWRETEEDLMSHPAFQETLGRALTREEFEEHYTAQVDLDDLDQYYLTNEKAWLADEKNVQPQFAAVNDLNSRYRFHHIGKIAYVEGGIGTGGLGTSILKWDLTVSEVRAIAAVDDTDGKWETVVRAILLKSDDTTLYPDLYIIFKSGNITITDKDVVANMGVSTHRIAEYWYTAGNAPFQQGAVEIHTNVITPEENDGAKGAPYNSWKPLTFENYLRSVFLNNFNSGNFTTWMKIEGAPSTSTQPFKAANMKIGIFFDDSGNGTYKGYLDAGAAKSFTVSNTTITDKTKKNLYATYGGTTQLIASIDGNWDGTAADLSNLKKMKVKLAETDYAKALLNYVDHELIGEPNVLKATIAVVPYIQNAASGDPIYSIDNNSWIKGAVKYTESGEDKYCKIKVTDYKFDVRFLRPISLSNLNSKVIEDATSETETTQKIALNDLVSGYTDFRGSITAPNWKPFKREKKDDEGNVVKDADGKIVYETVGDLTPYEEYYSPLGKSKFVVHVQNLVAGQYLSENKNVETNLNQKDPKTFVALNTVASDIIFQMYTDDVIEYRNNGSTVQEFQIRIPVEVEYFWGTIYDKVTVTVKKTQANARAIK